MDKIIRAIIVDDESGCISNLTSSLQRYCPSIHITGFGYNIDQARSLIQKRDFDIAFLDIELAHTTTFDLFHDKKPEFPIVFVTAYHQYAVRAFRVEAIDYLLKPLSSDDLIRCYIKIQKALGIVVGRPESKESGLSSTVTQPANRSVLIRSGNQVFVVKLSEVVYIEAQKFYTKLVFWHNGAKKQVLLSKPIGSVIDEYHYPQLIRVHKSFAINTQHIQTIIRQEYVKVHMDTGEEITIAKRRTHDFFKAVTTD